MLKQSYTEDTNGQNIDYRPIIYGQNNDDKAKTFNFRKLLQYPYVFLYITHNKFKATLTVLRLKEGPGMM